MKPILLCLLLVPSLSAAIETLDIISQQNTPTITINDKAHSVTTALQIKQHTIQQLAANQLTDILNNNASLSSWDYYGDGCQTTISLRGFGENASHNSLILLNGEPLASPDLGIDLSLIPLADIQRIEILPTSLSVLYGDQAVGGVVNIVTKATMPKPQRVSLFLGSYQQVGSQVSLNHVLSHGIKLSASGLFKHSQNFRDHNSNDQGHVNISLSQTSHTTPWRLYVSLLNRRVLFPGSLSQAQATANPRQSTSTTDWAKENKQLVQLSNAWHLTPHWRFAMLQLIRNEKNHGFMLSTYHDSSQLYRIEPKLHGAWHWHNSKLNLRQGISHAMSRYHYDSASYTAKINNRVTAVYQQAALTYRHYTASLGVRYMDAAMHMQTASILAQQQLTQHYHTLIKSLGFAWQITPQLKAYLRRAESYRLPSNDENSFTINGEPLQLQRGVSYETGLHVANAKWLIDENLFALYLNNEIAFAPKALMPNQFTNQNLAQTRRLGFSQTIHWQVTPIWQLLFNNSLLQATMRDGSYHDKRIPFVADLTAKLGSQWQLKPNWSIYLEAVYTGRRYPGSDLANRFPMLASTTLINAAIRFDHQPYHISLRLDNLNNKAYFAYATTNGHTVGYYPAAGRRFLLNLSLDC